MKLKDRWVDGWLTATSGMRFGVYAYTDTKKKQSNRTLWCRHVAVR